MSDTLVNEKLLCFFKALADANRLKIIGLLATQPYSVEQLAAMLNLRPSTTSHHLKHLAEAGLVSARSESYYNIYHLEQGVIEQVAHDLLSRQAFPSPSKTSDSDQDKVIKDYSLADGSLKTIPVQHRKLLIILRHIAQTFTPGVRYSERQVNHILSRFHSDTASLRRELVGAHIMSRAAGEYWLTESEQE